MRAVLIVPYTQEQFAQITAYQTFTVGISTKRTIHVNNIKHYFGLCPNTYRLEPTVLFDS